VLTARRYLEYLADNGLAKREPHYGQVGRPEIWYRALHSGAVTPHTGFGRRTPAVTGGAAHGEGCGLGHGR